MIFKGAAMLQESKQLHPDVKFALLDLDDFCKAKGYPEIVVTMVLRTAAQQEEIYWRQIANSMHLSEIEARKLARKKFSWHKVGCAADIRNRHYTKEQRGQIMLHLLEGRTKGPWEILEHDVGRGDHIHIGRRDFAFRSKWEASHKEK